MIGPANSNLGKPMGGKQCDVTSVEDYPPLLGPVVSGDTIQQAGLAGAIRSDDGDQLS